MKARHATRRHDGVACRETAPKMTFFSAEDFHYTISLHPVRAEPGELLASLVLPLDNFVQNRGEYRLFLLSCVPQGSGTAKEPVLRATVLFSRRDSWEWCSDEQLIELDLTNNPLLSYNTRTGAWTSASQFVSPVVGRRPVRVVVAVAGYEVNFRDFTSLGLQVRVFEAAHVFRVCCHL